MIVGWGMFCFVSLLGAAKGMKNGFDKLFFWICDQFYFYVGTEYYYSGV